MITSTDKLTMDKYFTIICSDPLDLRPLGFGTNRMRMKAWMEIRKQDDALNPTHTNERVEMYEEYDYLQEKTTKLKLCYITLSVRDSENCNTILEGYGIYGGDRQSKIGRLVDQLKGTYRMMNDILEQFKEVKKITKIDCMKELMTIAKHFPVTIKSSLSEYRGAQRNYIEMVEAMNKDGHTDN